MKETIFAILTDAQARSVAEIEASLDLELIVGGRWL
jgi:hypothetical protein